MSVSACRACDGPFFPEPVFRYANQPKGAQHLPSADDLASERGVDLEVCQCARCGLVQLSNDPVDYWREVIRASAGSPEMMAFRRRQFGEFVERFGLAGKRVLEPGCGRGEYLAVMRDAGADVHGLEWGEAAVADARTAGLDVDRGFITARTQIATGPFDAFFTLNYLEHVPDPRDFLAGIHANLAEGAVGIVEVPNFDMIARQGLFAEFITDHLSYFTQDTLSRLLEDAGFEVVACDVVWHEYIVSATVRKRDVVPNAQRPPSSGPVGAFVGTIERLDTAPFETRFARFRDSIASFVGETESADDRIAIWGAGHQAFTVMAMFGLDRHVAYVVDSAPFKQGRFTPGTHLPIVAPDALAADPVDAVIVMAASYSDEVVRIIRERFGDGVNLAVLREDGLRKVT